MQREGEDKTHTDTKPKRVQEDARSITEVKEALGLNDYSEMDAVTLSEYVKTLAYRASVLSINDMTIKERDVYNKHFKGASTALDKINAH